MRASLKLGYGIGQISDGVKQTSFSIFLFFYYQQVLGLSGTLAGTAGLLALIVDAITDPMVGQLSDRFKSRWGRRHPFMLVGAIPFGLAMFLLFSPPAGLETAGLFSWMLGWAVVVRLLLTFFFVPHLSLGAEMVRDYHERTSLIAYRVFFSFAGGLVVAAVGFIVFFPPSEAFPNGMLNAASYPTFGLFAGIFGALAMFWSIYATRSTIPGLTKPIDDPDASHPLLGFITVFQTLKHKAFRILFSTTLLFMIMAGVTQTLIIYVGTYLFGFAPQHLGLLVFGPVIGIVAAPTVAKRMSRKMDKRRTLATCVIIGSMIAFLPQVLFLTGVLQPLELTTRLLIVFLAHGVSQTFFIAYIIIIDSMLSDTIDEHELRSGRREEGLYFAARSFATKAAYGLGSFFAGIMLDVIRFPQGANPTDVPLDALTKLAIVAGPMSAVLFMMTVLISRNYPLDAARHKEIIRDIDARAVTAGVQENP